MNLAAVKRRIARIEAQLGPAGPGTIYVPRGSGMLGLRKALQAVQAVQGGSPAALPTRAIGACQGSPFERMRTAMRIEKAKRETLELAAPESSHNPKKAALIPAIEEPQPCQIEDAN